ncbi:negative control protein of sporulation [Salmonella enterica]
MITTYPIELPFPQDSAYQILKNAYIAGIRNKKGRILASIVFLTETENSGSEGFIENVQKLFSSYEQTKSLVKKAVSVPVSKLRINLENGSISQAFSESELEMLFSEFYFNNSISGRA